MCTDAPDIRTQTDRTEAPQGSLVRFTCIVEAVPAPAISWTNENRQSCTMRAAGLSRYEYSCSIQVSSPFIHELFIYTCTVLAL